MAHKNKRNRHKIARLLAQGLFLAALSCSACSVPKQELPASPAIMDPADNKPSHLACDIAAAYPGRSVDIDSLPKRRPQYFPKSPADARDRNFDPVQHEWYGKHLQALGEKSLLRDVDEEIYRFTWLRSFHNPVTVRIESHGSMGGKLFSVENDGSGGYEPGERLRYDEIPISRDEWCHFIRLLNASDFWSLPSMDSDRLGRDGAQWILEGVRFGRYHVIDRWDAKDEPMGKACQYLLSLSGRDLKKMGEELY